MRHRSERNLKTVTLSRFVRGRSRLKVSTGASHSRYVAHPKEVADVINRAAREVSK